MRLNLRIPRGMIPISVIVCGAGVIGLWQVIPVGPREGWGLPTDEVVRGLLGDDRTLLTTPRLERSTNPIRLRDLGSGRLLASHYGADGDAAVRMFVCGSKDLIGVHERIASLDSNTEN